MYPTLISNSLLDQICSYKVHYNQVCYSQVRYNQVRYNQVRYNQVCSNQVRYNQVRSNQVRSNQVCYNQVRYNQVRNKVSYKRFLIFFQGLTFVLGFSIFSAVLGMLQFGYNTGVINAPESVSTFPWSNFWLRNTGLDHPNLT